MHFRCYDSFFTDKKIDQNSFRIWNENRIEKKSAQHCFGGFQSCRSRKTRLMDFQNNGFPDEIGVRLYVQPPHTSGCTFRGRMCRIGTRSFILGAGQKVQLSNSLAQWQRQQIQVRKKKNSRKPSFEERKIVPFVLQFFSFALFDTCRYFCSHNAGIHAITLPMVSQFDEYVGAKNGSWISKKNFIFCSQSQNYTSRCQLRLFFISFLSQTKLMYICQLLWILRTLNISYAPAQSTRSLRKPPQFLVLGCCNNRVQF